MKVRELIAQLENLDEEKKIQLSYWDKENEEETMYSDVGITEDENGYILIGQEDGILK